MAQTTGAMTFKACAVALSTDGNTWTDVVSGSTNEVTVSGGDRATGEAFTFDGDTPIVTAGKRGALDVTVKYIYTETAGEAQVLVKASYEAGTPFYVRWTPKVAGFIYTTGAGYVTSQPYPSGSAASADAITSSFTVKVPTITKS